MIRWKNKFYWLFRDIKSTLKAFFNGAPKRCCNRGCWYSCKGHVDSGG